MLRSDRSGSGAPTLLLLPGLLCTQRLWDRARPLLEAFHDVLTVDLPGVGGGDLAEGAADLEAYADRVCEVLDAVREHGVAAYADRQMPRTFREDAREEDVEAALRQARDWPEDAVVRALEAMRDRPDRTPLLLEHTELPVLLIQGDDDPAIDALDPEEGHVTRIVTDTAHMGVLTDPHTFAGIVHGWVADELERSA